MIAKDMTIEPSVDLRIIYIRFRGSYGAFRRESGKLFKELFAFATAQDLIVPEVTKVLTIYDDNPFITKNNDLRTSVAMTIPKDVSVTEEGLITLGEIKGKFAVGHYELNQGEYSAAWQEMYQTYLNNDTTKIRDAVPFELYVTEPPKNAKDKSLTDIYLPVQ